MTIEEAIQIVIQNYEWLNDERPDHVDLEDLLPAMKILIETAINTIA